jgi:hypothetical protein
LRRFNTLKRSDVTNVFVKDVDPHYPRRRVGRELTRTYRRRNGRTQPLTQPVRHLPKARIGQIHPEREIGQREAATDEA